MQNQIRIQNLENQLAMEKFVEEQMAEAFITWIKILRDQMDGAGIQKTSEEVSSDLSTKV